MATIVFLSSFYKNHFPFVNPIHFRSNVESDSGIKNGIFFKGTMSLRFTT